MLRSALAVSALLVLAGCPDAVRGTPAGGPGESGPDGVGEASGQRVAASAPEEPHAGDAGATSTTPRTGTVVANASGNLALTPTHVLVATPSAVVRVAKNAAGPTGTADVYAGAARTLGATDRLFLVHAIDAFTVTAPDGSAPRVIRTGRLVDAAAGVAAIGGALVWSAGSGTRALHVTDTAAEDATTPIRDGDTSHPVTHLAGAGTDVILGLQRCGCIGPDGKNFDLVRRRLLWDADDTPLGTVQELVGLVADARSTFALERGRGLRGFSLDGSAVSSSVSGAADLFDAGAMALDATHVYWTSRTRGQILRARRDGGDAQPEVFAEGLALPVEDELHASLRYDLGRGRLAVDDTFVWVSDASHVVRFPK